MVIKVPKANLSQINAVAEDVLSDTAPDNVIGPTQQESTLRSSTTRLIERLPLEKIDSDRAPAQTRTIFDPDARDEDASLAASIADHGVLQPISVMVYRVEDGKQRYKLIAGERRLLASQYVNEPTIRAIVFPEGLVGEQRDLLTIIENSQRLDLNPIELANAMTHMINVYSYTQEQVADVVGRSRKYVGQCLQLLSAPTDVIKLVDQQSISVRDAHRLAELPKAKRQAALELADSGQKWNDAIELAHDDSAALPADDTVPPPAPLPDPEDTKIADLQIDKDLLKFLGSERAAVFVKALEMEGVTLSLKPRLLATAAFWLAYSQNIGEALVAVQAFNSGFVRRLGRMVLALADLPEIATESNPDEITRFASVLDMVVGDYLDSMKANAGGQS